MAEIAEEVNRGDAQDLHSLLSSPAKAFLVCNDGQQVKIESLKGKKTIGLYCGPSQEFTPQLIEVYNEISAKVGFEIVLVPFEDEDEESYKENFITMPWLAVPFTDSETRTRLNKLFNLIGIPSLVIIDNRGVLVNEDAIDVIQCYGADAYPFTRKRIKELKEEEDKAWREQTLKSILVTPTRDFVISQEGNKVPVSELEGKTIGLLFSEASYGQCSEFTPKLVEFYKMLKEKGEDFEIVMISLEDDEESFKKDFETKPWLALPFNDKRASKLARHFNMPTLTTLVILGPDGKTRHSDVVEAVDEYGVLAYPFTPEKFEELKEIEKAKAEAQTLESLLVSGDLNYVFGKDGAKVLVSDLVGKNMLLYFSAHWCPPCRAFTPKLVEVYKQIKEQDEALELIFISSDEDQESFEEYYSEMPWLALPFGDPRKPSLAKTFKVFGIPMLAALGPTGKTVTTEARDLVGAHGADAYPFTEERLREIEVKYDEMAKEWPKKLKHPLHEEHELELTRVQVYGCDKCDEEGQIWSYHCAECDFDLHAKCALKEDTKETGDEAVVKAESQTLESLLVSGDLNYVLDKDGAKVLVSDLVGKNILLYVSAHWCPPCSALTPKLVEVYKHIKERDDAFELIFISCDQDQESFDEYYSEMPWLALPYDDPRKPSLARTLKFSSIPMLVALGPTGKTLTKEATDLVLAHGADVYPFTEERLKEIEVKCDEMAKGWPKKVKHTLHEEHKLELTRVPLYMCDKCDEEGKIWSYRCYECDFDLHPKCALKEDTKETGGLKAESQTLESLLVSGDLNYVLNKDGAKVLVSDLVGKNILLYFSANWHLRCRAFTPNLVEAYKLIKERDEAFELIFVGDPRPILFEDVAEAYTSQMPWLFLPHNDTRTRSLGQAFTVRSIPMLVALGPTGKTITKEATNLVEARGADAYPFTEVCLKEFEVECDEMAKGWSKKVKHTLHEHELELTRLQHFYMCGKCAEHGEIWSYRCAECNFDLHAKCALKDETGNEAVKEGGSEKEGGDGWVCDGNVCTKA